MYEKSLAGRSVLVVEDEYLFADDLAQTLEEAGAKVVGPVPTVESALALIAGGAEIDMAVLDANLHGEFSWSVADLLTERAVPILFVTGYDSHFLPSRFRHRATLGKPIDTAQIVLTLELLT